MNELSQLDELIESDVLDALNNDEKEPIKKEVVTDSEDEILIEDFDEKIEADSGTENNKDEILIEDFDENIEGDSGAENNKDEILIEDFDENIETEKVVNEQETLSEINTTDLASLLSQLLNNKTIEITIKIKD